MDGTFLDFLGSAQPAFLFVLHLVQIGAIVAVLRYLDIYEREPYATILMMFFWGALGAVFLALFGNALVASLLPTDVAAVFGAAISAPIVEELAKGAALVAAFAVSHWWARRHGTHPFEGPTDGIVYGVAVGMGFAFSENILFFTNFALESGDILGSGVEVFLLRVDFTGFGVLGHGLYTGLFGAGLGIATWKQGVGAKIAWAGGGLLAGMAAHAWWNGFATLYAVRSYGFAYLAGVFTGAVRVTATEEEAIVATFEQGQAIMRGVFLVMLAVMAMGFALWLRYERRIIHFELAEEVRSGLLTAEELDLVLRFWRRTRCYVDLFRAGRRTQRRAVARLHEQLVDLALMKWRVRQFGGDVTAIARDREEIAALRAYTNALERIHGPLDPSRPPPEGPTRAPPVTTQGQP